MFTLYRTEHVFKNFLLFWVLCALDVNCIEPTRASVCDKNKLWNREDAGKGCWEQMSEIDTYLICSKAYT